MTLEEAKALALQGDVGAMCSLGNFFVQQNDADGIEEAVKWFNMAAEQGVPYAITMAVRVKLIEARYCWLMPEDAMLYHFAKDEWQIAFDYAQREGKMFFDQFPETVQDAEIEGRTWKESFADFSEAAYNLGVCYCYLGDYQNAYKYGSRSSEPWANMLKALCKFKLAETPEEMNDAYEWLKEEVWSESFPSSFASRERTKRDEAVFIEAALYYSAFLRTGAYPGGKPDLEQAYGWLKHVESCLQTQEQKMRGLLQKELSRYKKKMFGGMKYE